MIHEYILQPFYSKTEVILKVPDFFNRKFKFKIGFIISSLENNSLDTDDLSDFPTLSTVRT